MARLRHPNIVQVGRTAGLTVREAGPLLEALSACRTALGLPYSEQSAPLLLQFMGVSTCPPAMVTGEAATTCQRLFRLLNCHAHLCQHCDNG